jgi:polysaccharide biosynthesis acetyltransferase WcbI-like protein
MSSKPVIAVAGDAQAEALALILRSLPAVADSYDVAYAGAELSQSSVSHARFALVQDGAAQPRRLPKTCKRITFPVLRLRLLWPMAAPGPQSAAGSAAALVWGDSFISQCVEQCVPAEKILRLYEAPVWSESWPNLDALFTQETTALLQADAKSDVKIGSYVLKHFRKQRLFWAMNAPSNALLGELTYRILHACFGRDVPADREAIAVTLASFGLRELMSRAALPVHPLVAEHFGLEWHDSQERYPGFDGELRTFHEYYRELVDYLSPAKVK